MEVGGIMKKLLIICCLVLGCIVCKGAVAPMFTNIKIVVFNMSQSKSLYLQYLDNSTMEILPGQSGFFSWDLAPREAIHYEYFANGSLWIGDNLTLGPDAAFTEYCTYWIEFVRCAGVEEHPDFRPPSYRNFQIHNLTASNLDVFKPWIKSKIRFTAQGSAELHLEVY